MYTLESDTQNESRSFDNTTGMKVGDVAIILSKASGYLGHFLLRAYNGFIDLNDPQHTWEKGVFLEVKPVPKGTKIVLTVK